MHLFRFHKKKHPRKARSTGGGSDESSDGSDDEHVVPQLSQHETENTNPTVPEHPGIQKSNSSPSTPQEVASTTNRFHNRGVLDAMLQQETQELADSHERKKSDELQRASERPRKLKFELPERPPRSPRQYGPSMEKRHSLPEEILLSSVKRVPRRRRLLKLFSRDSDEESWSSENAPTYGDHVRILHRPVVMTGRVVYMGSVHFEAGDDWYGIELDQPVGSHDGVKHGQRYFQTDRNRAIFVRRKDVEFLDEDSNK